MKKENTIVIESKLLKAVFEINPAGRILSAENDLNLELGYSINESAGKTIFDVLKPFGGIKKYINKGLKGKSIGCSINWNESIYELQMIPLYYKNGRIKNIILTITDVTKKIPIENEVSGYLRRIKFLHQNAKIGYWELDIINNNLKWSDEVFEIIKIDKEKFGASYEAFLQVVHPEDRDAVDNAYTNSLNTKEPYEIVHRLLMKDGNVKYVRENCETEYDSKGNPLVSRGTVQDITKYKMTEETYNLTEKRYNKLFDSMMDAFVSVNMEGQILTYNKTYKDMLGYNDEELKKLTYTDITPVKWHDLEQKIVEEEIIPNGFSRVYEKEYRRKDGTIFPIELRTYLLKDEKGKPEEMWAIIRDITGRKEQDTLLQVKALQFRTLYEGMIVGFVKVDMEGRFTEFNDIFKNMLGYDKDELSKITFQEITPEKWHEADLNVINNQLIPRGYSDLFEKEFIRKDGSIIAVEVMGAFLKNEKNEPTGIWAWVRDITERKKYEDEIYQTGLRYRTLFEQSPYGVVLIDITTGDTLEANAAAAKQLGYTQEEFNALRISDYEAVENVEETALHINKVISEGADEFDTLHRTKSGSIRNVRVYSKAITINEHLCILAIYRDITERMLAEEELQIRNGAMMSAISGIAMSDMDGKINYVNRAWLKMHGYETPEEVIGTTPLDHVQNPEEAINIVESIKRMNNWRGELICRRRDGTFFPAELVSNVVTNRAGQPIRLLASFLDITKRKEIEERLLVFAQAIETSSNPFIVVDMQGNITFCNRATEELYNYEAGELLGANISILDADPQHQQEVMIPAIQKYGKWAGRVNGRRKDGSIVPEWLTTSIIIGSAGSPIGILGIVQDITEQEKAGQAISEQALLLDLIFKYSQDSMAILDRDYNFVRVTESFARAGAKEVSDYTGKNHFEMYPSDFKEEADDVKRRKYVYHKTERPFVYADHPEWGVTYWDLDFVTILDAANEVELFLMTIKNVTDRKLAEMALRESKEKYRILISNSTDMISRHTADGKVIFVSPVSESLTGYKPLELIGKDATFFIPSEEHTRVRNTVSSSFENGDEYIVEHSIIRKDGKIINVETKGSAKRDSEGNIIEIFCNVRDITERKKLEKDLELKDNAVQNALTGIAISDTNGILTYVNRSLLQLWGYEKVEEVTGKNVFEFWQDGENITEIVESLGSKNKWSGERIAKRRDGSTFVAQIMGNYLTDDYGNPTHFLGSFIDITERKKKDRLISDSLKEKEILLQEIHHRVKNNLQIVGSMLYLQLLQLSDENTVKIINDILSRIKTMGLVHEYLYQSRDYKNLDFREYVAGLISVLKETYISEKQTVNIKFEVKEGIPFEKAIYCGLIINELVSNSLKYAFEGKKDGLIRINFEKIDGFYLLNVSDNGKGIKDYEEIRGRNTLGMRIVDTLAEQLMGSSEFLTTNGTEVRITFPE